MAIPEITFPVTLDTSTNLYSVADALTLPLAKDYSPGDTIIYVAQDAVIMAQFPVTGIITLTENCSPTEYRATSFYYGAKDNINFTFSDLTVLDETPDKTEKKAGATNVSMNVTAQHHNSIKNATLNIEEYLGVTSDVGILPFEGTINGRTNFLLKTVFTPRAWFVATPLLGKITPGFGMEVTFTSYCLYLGEELPNNTITYTWDFGDSNVIPPATQTTTNPVITHTYLSPGIYTISMTVQNKFGQDTVTFVGMIDALYVAPAEAEIVVGWPGNAEFDPSKPGLKNFPTRIPPYLKAPTGAYVDVYTTDLVIVGSDPLRADNGAWLIESPPGIYTEIDPIVSYTWDLSDTLSHATTTPVTKALYTIGGDYQVVLRCDTDSEAYRITQNYKYINAIERQNAWLFTFGTGAYATSVYASELGFLNETFKTKQVVSTVITKDSSFLDYIADPLQQARAKNEFNTNNNLNARSTTPSGLQGFSILSWASGRTASQSSTLETVNCVNYNGFQETYDTPVGFQFNRPWNWIPFNGTSVIYYILGNAATQPPSTSPTNLNVDIQSLIDGSRQTYAYTNASFTAQADLLEYNAAQYDPFGQNIYGAYSAYRTAFRGRSGYILKNTTVGNDFMIKSFYATVESTSYLLDSFKKLPDMPGPVKTQGQLVNLTTGLFFFNNSGSVLAFDPSVNIWKTGGPGYNSITFSNLQDKTVPDYDNENNALVATTDFASNAFLSFDYSNNAFIKFNDVDLSFSKLSSRPSGTQWLFGSY
jgi:PKD repeat protein